VRSAEPLLPIELGSGKIKFAQGVKAGRWVFATGLMAQDFIHGIAPEVLAQRTPHAGLPKQEKEAARLAVAVPSSGWFTGLGRRRSCEVASHMPDWRFLR
jgi:hypothetical protein